MTNGLASVLTCWSANSSCSRCVTDSTKLSMASNAPTYPPSPLNSTARDVSSTKTRSSAGVLAGMVVVVVFVVTVVVVVDGAVDGVDVVTVVDCGTAHRPHFTGQPAAMWSKLQNATNRVAQPEGSGLHAASGGAGVGARVVGAGVGGGGGALVVGSVVLVVAVLVVAVAVVAVLVVPVAVVPVTVVAVVVVVAVAVAVNVVVV